MLRRPLSALGFVLVSAIVSMLAAAPASAQTLSVTPTTEIVATGNFGGPFSPPSFDYAMSAQGGAVNYEITGVPTWLTSSLALTGTIASGTSKAVTFTVNASANSEVPGVRVGAITFFNRSNINSQPVGFNVTLNINQAATSGSLVSAVLPASRSVQVGTAATAFMTVINTSSFTATSCGLGFGSNIAAAFRYQTTDPSTNAVTGSANTPVNIPAGKAQSYVFAITPGASFNPVDVSILAGCSNTPPAPTVVGLNTLLLSASTSAVPDIVALAATASNDGIVSMPVKGTGAFALATVNVGSSAGMTVSGDTGDVSLPVTILLCPTDPNTGQCTQPTETGIAVNIAANATPTFAVFVQAIGAVPFDPAHNRVFIRFKDSNGVVRGATSVAIRTQ